MKRSHSGKCLGAIAVLALSVSPSLSVIFAQADLPTPGNKEPLPHGRGSDSAFAQADSPNPGNKEPLPHGRGSDLVFAQADSPAPGNNEGTGACTELAEGNKRQEPALGLPKGTGVFAQAVSPDTGLPASQSSASPGLSTAAPAGLPEVVTRRYHLEASSFNNMVSNGFGNWWGGGLLLSWQPSHRVLASGSIFSQSRPGQREQLGDFRTLVNWSKWFYTDVEVSGGGPEDPAAFFPKLRYDLTANLKVPLLPRLILTGGLTRLYFGVPNNGRIRRAGAIYYWRHFVFQGNLNFNNARPGNLKSKSANGAVQFGQEGHYWMGLVAGGGREAWQTLTFTPQDVEFTSYSTSVFLRKWLAPSYGVAFYYSYTLKHIAYRINGLEMKFFVEF